MMEVLNTIVIEVYTTKTKFAKGRESQTKVYVFTTTQNFNVNTYTFKI